MSFGESGGISTGFIPAFGLYLFLLCSGIYTIVSLMPLIKRKTAIASEIEPVLSNNEPTATFSIPTIEMAKLKPYLLIATVVILAIGVGAFVLNRPNQDSVSLNIATDKAPHITRADIPTIEPIQTAPNTESQDQTSAKDEVYETGVHHYGEEEASENAFAGEYTQASRMELDAGDLNKLSKAQLRLMRNEVMARHGYIFSSPDLDNYFRKQSWYTPKSNDVTGRLTEIEKKNIALIKQWEK